MSLSQASISAIVAALLHERTALVDDLAFWGAHWRRPGKATFYEQVCNALQANTAALTELADSMAPWLKQHPTYPFNILLKDPV